jgi:hypothetical protein
MAYLQLRTNNSDFSHVITKNPDSEPSVIGKEIRQGFAFGWFDDSCSYNIYYTEPPEINSYTDEKVGFSYLNSTVLASPYVYLNLIADFFRTALKTNQDLDIETYVEIKIGFLTLENSHYLNIFKRFFPGFVIAAEEVTKDRYSILISGQTTIHKLLNFTCVFLLFAAVFDRETFVFTEEDLLAKYIQCLEVIKVPYFIAYLFKINLLRSPENFEKVKEKLESAVAEDCALVYGNTLQQRKSWVKKQLEGLSQEPYHLVDFGAGYDFNYRFLAKDENLVSYIPVDTDEEARKEIDAKTQYKFLKKVTPCLSDLTELDDAKLQKSKAKTIILATEVFEHIEWSDAIEYLHYMLMREYVSAVVITLPNNAFNKLYDLESPGFRHEDHKWEPYSTWEPLGLDDKIQQMFGQAKSAGFTFSLSPVGDIVDGVPCTLGIVFVKESV